MMKFRADLIKTLVLLLAVFLTLMCGCSQNDYVPQKPEAELDGGCIKISWATVSEAEGYRLLKKADTDTDFKFLCDVKATEYIDDNVEKGKSYQYKLSVLFKDYNSDFSVTDVITVPTNNDGQDVGNLTPPTITSVTRLDKYTAVILFSDTVAGAEYEVLRKTGSNANFTVIGTTTTNSYYDTNAEFDGEYYYTARVKGTTDTNNLKEYPIGTNAKETIHVPIMMYHEFVTQKDLDSGVLFDEYAIWQSELEEDLIWLKNNGYTTITTKQLSDYLEGNGTLPEKPIILTIDDGKLGVYKNAYPMLQKHKMVMSLAVIGYQIDMASADSENRGSAEAPYSTWDEIAEMSDSGHVEITSHTQRLHIFNHDGRQGACTKADDTLQSYLPIAQRDFSQLFVKIKKATGKENYTLAYPYSKRTVLSDQAWLASGYKVLLGGDDEAERKTMSNYFIQEAGINRDSAVMRRIPRMTGKPISDYLAEINQHDFY